MHGIIFMGLQGSGKSSFFFKQYAPTHLRLNQDMLKTRYREAILLKACLDAKQPVVIDNTNPTVQKRATYIQAFKQARFDVIGFYFQSSLEVCLKRNQLREGKERIPEVGLKGTYNQLELPSYKEGYDQLFYVSLKNDDFEVQEWQGNEI